MNHPTGVVRGTWPQPEHDSGVGSTSRDGHVPASWPLTDMLTLGALLTAVGSARVHTQMVLSEWAMANLIDNTILIVSELVTNAVLASTDTDGRPRYFEGHSGLPIIHLRLSSDHVRLAIEVWDLSSQAPVMQQPERDAENGHGLVLVQAISERWGWGRVIGWPGKVVWAQLHVQ
jgi:hypothetical protein